MKGYGQFCPIAVASEIVAERWTPLILRELVHGARRFGEIRLGVPLMSRTLLVQRLRTLEQAGLVESRLLPGGRGHEYVPTEAALEFGEVLERLGVWGQRWATTQFEPENIDLGILMWNMRRRVNEERLPERRVVARFDFRNFPPRFRNLRTWWLLLDRKGSEVCLKDPMLDTDLKVDADAGTLARVWVGDTSFADALRGGGVQLEGPRELVRAFPDWFLLSPFAGVDRPLRASDTST